jgi:hypothetical protein
MNGMTQVATVRDQVVATLEPFITTFVTKMKYRLLSKGFDHVEAL